MVGEAAQGRKGKARGEKGEAREGMIPNNFSMKINVSRRSSAKPKL